VTTDGDRLAPGMLLAMPQLLDPNFRRTVILLSAHDEDGSMGLVVNRPLGATVKEVLEGLGIPWNGAADTPTWGGGPVMPRTGWVLFEPEGGVVPGEVAEIAPGLCLSASIDTLRALARKPPRRFRLILGYSGWGGGQLEGELVEGAWMVSPVDVELVWEAAPDRAWAQAFRRLGIEPASIVPSDGVQ
jgi:putative transcriptional regulator